MNFNKEQITTFLKHPPLADWYRAYLRSYRWKSKTEKVKQRAKGKCEDCFTSQGPFCTHHLTYEFVLKERLKDLKYLCEACHTKRHTKKIIPFSEFIYRENKFLFYRVLMEC